MHTSDCYAESFVQSESHALSTNLPTLYRNVEIQKKTACTYANESGCT